MKIITTKFHMYLLVVIVAFITFIEGAALGVRYSNTLERSTRELALAENLALLRACKIGQCSEFVQRMLVYQNDAALYSLDALERDSANPFLRYAGLSVRAMLYGIDFHSNADTTSDQFRKYYAKLGCGIDGIICVNHGK